MRVIFVSTAVQGGTVSHIRDLAPAVARRGADVTVVCATDDVAAKFPPTVRAVVLPIASKGDVRQIRPLHRLMKGSDVVHTHDRRAHLYGLPLARLIGAAGIRTFHGLPEEIASVVNGFPEQATVLPLLTRVRVYWVTLRAEDALNRVAAHTIVPTSPFAAFLMARGADPRRLSVIPSGIDVPSWRAEVSTRDVFTIATVAALEAHKGVDIIIRALGRVTMSTRLHVYGEGKERAALEALAHNVGVDVVFEGQVDDARRAMRHCDAFVLASRADNLPIALLEAMSIGLPVVCTRVGGVHTVVRDDESGLMIEADDDAALAKALSDLGRSLELRARLGDAAREHVRKFYDIEAVAKRVMSLYEQLCASCM